MIVLSKLIGRAGLRRMLAWGGIESSGGVLEQFLDIVKSDEFLEMTEMREIIHYLEGHRRRIHATEQTSRKRSKHHQVAFV